MTEDEATRWLALFGSASRPPAKLVSSEIQSLVFGGLRFMPFGCVLLMSLPAQRADAKRWLAALRPHVAFDDGRRLLQSRTEIQAVVTLALGPAGLAGLGLPDEALRSFPFAFREGMATEPRTRILGDVGRNAPEHWAWGSTPADAALLVYGASAADVERLLAVLDTLAGAHGAAVLHRIPLRPVGQTDKREPFGFVDGISQPVIRGTYKALRDADPVQLVEPGEFILGYPDNSGNLPPGPVLPALADPANALPLVAQGDGFDRAEVDGPRDLGRNGSFLVIRQLQQDVRGFQRYCESEAARLAGRLPPPYVLDAEFIAAKLVGRWRDGSSLVRHPYRPRSHQGGQPATTRPAAPASTPHPIKKTVSGSGDDNDFLFGTEDPEALRCPFGAHVRRANPRDSLDPGSADQIAISNRHRILRVGREYVPADGADPGLLFMCLNGDIERQFEFVQQTWLGSPSFHGLSCEKDALLGDGEAGACGYTIPTRQGPVRLSPVPPFITMRGGGYFFLPGRRLLDHLAEA